MAVNIARAQQYNRGGVGGWDVKRGGKYNTRGDRQLVLDVIALQEVLGDTVDGMLGPRVITQIANTVNALEAGRSGLGPVGGCGSAFFANLEIPAHLRGRDQINPAPPAGGWEHDVPAVQGGTLPSPGGGRTATGSSAGQLQRSAPVGLLPAQLLAAAKAANVESAKALGWCAEAPYSGPSCTLLANDVAYLQRACGLGVTGIVDKDVLTAIKALGSLDKSVLAQKHASLQQLSAGVKLPSNLWWWLLALAGVGGGWWAWRRYGSGSVTSTKRSDIKLLR